MSAPYFLIHRVELVPGGALVDGRLGESAIKKGHLFNRSFESSEAWREEEKGEFRACRLVVSGIEAYRKALDELSGGMTARLRIEGDGLDVLPVSKVLK